MRTFAALVCALSLAACGAGGGDSSGGGGSGGGLAGEYTPQDASNLVAKIELRNDGTGAITLSAAATAGTEAENAPPQPISYVSPTEGVVILHIGDSTAEYIVNGDCLVAPNGMQWCR